MTVFTFLEKMRHFPCGVWFLLVSKLIDTLVTFQSVSQLYIYTTSIMKMTELDATFLYEGGVSLTILTNFGTAYLADTKVGKYRMLTVGCCIRIVGYAILTLGGVLASTARSLGVAMALSLVGILLRTLGGGAITPTLPTLGGDQFDADHQNLLPTFFFALYFFDKLGSVLGLVIGPKLRALRCLTRPTCFPLAFGVQTIFSVLMLAIVVAGSNKYVRIQPLQNSIVEASKRAAEGLRHLLRRQKGVRSKLTVVKSRQILDAKHVMQLFLLFTPFPFFWALQQQQNSRWIYQGKRMDGDVFNTQMPVIEPEQMELAAPLLAVLLLPIFDRCLYPGLAKIGLLRKPLQRMGIGMALAIVSFLLSARVEVAVGDVDPAPQTAGHALLQVFNGAPCVAQLRIAWPDGEVTSTMAAHTLWSVSVTQPRGVHSVAAYVNTSCTTPTHSTGFPALAERRPTLLVVTAPRLTLRSCDARGPGAHKSATGNVRVALALAAAPTQWADDATLVESGLVTARDALVDTGRDVSLLAGRAGVCTKFAEARFNAHYMLRWGGVAVSTPVTLRRGGVYLLFVWRNGSELGVTAETLTPYNKVNMLWQLPQIVAISLGEIFFVLSGNELAYTHAPASMRTLVRAGWGATRGLGSILVLATLQLMAYKTIVEQLLLFALGLAADLVYFIVLAHRYKEREVYPEEVTEDSEETHAIAVADS